MARSAYVYVALHSDEPITTLVGAWTVKGEMIGYLTERYRRALYDLTVVRIRDSDQKQEDITDEIVDEVRVLKKEHTK